MTLAVNISAGDSGHIEDHEEIHQLLNEASSLSEVPGRQTLFYPEHLRRSYGRIANSRYSQSCVVIGGDSISLGAYSNDVLSSDEATWRVRGFVPQLRSLFSDRFGDVGEGFIYLGDPRVTLGSGVNLFSDSSIGPFQNSVSLSSGQTVTVALPACTAIEVFAWWDTGVGAFITNVDGAGDVTSASQSGSDLFYSVTVASGLTNTTHSVVIKGPASGVARVYGVAAWVKQDSGVAVHRLAKSGAVLKDFTQMFNGSSTSAIRSAKSWSTALNADLAILAFSANNVTTGVSTHGLSAAQIETGFQAVVDFLVGQGIDVLLVGGPERNPSSYSVGFTQQEADDLLQSIAADTDRVAFLDYKALFDFEEGDGYDYYIDNVHPTLLGHSTMARALYDALGGRL